MPTRHAPETLPAADSWTFNVHGNGMLPLYAHGDRIVVSQSADFGIGDPVTAITLNGRLVAGLLFFRSNSVVYIAIGGWRGRIAKLHLGRLKAFGRIVSASQ
jgi:phage repressor protein C with HTH and peptisase S24 domain